MMDSLEIRNFSICGEENGMKEKAICIARWLLPVVIAAYFPYRFYGDIAHYQVHHDDIAVFFHGMISLLICGVLIVMAIRRRSWVNLALCCVAVCSCVFFCYWCMRIPLCQECEPLTVDELGFMLRPYAERFGIDR